MPTERSDKVYETYRQAVEKFDYFILGVTGALCAYISQVYKLAQVTEVGWAEVGPAATARVPAIRAALNERRVCMGFFQEWLDNAPDHESPSTKPQRIRFHLFITKSTKVNLKVSCRDALPQTQLWDRAHPFRPERCLAFPEPGLSANGQAIGLGGHAAARRLAQPPG
ncbi:MAG: hypothetical protein R3E56_14345 [Burkholderiaceae bacterium]